MRLFFIIFILFYTICTNIALADNSFNTFTDRQDVQVFIDYMVKKHHFKKQALYNIFNQVKLRPQVIRRINKPFEKESWHTYQRLFITEWRIKEGLAFWQKYANALKRAEQTYGIPASIIVATIGIESKYGQRTGEYRVIDSLSNLAFNHTPRAKFFKSELEEFLLLVRDKKLNPFTIMGSYAGAIGQPQFMPSSYRYYAVNFSNSGSIDLMHDEIDVIGSIANYYKKHGWIENSPVVMQGMAIGSRYDYLKRNNQIDSSSIAIADLSKYGILPKQKIRNNNLKVKIIELDSIYQKEYWLGFHNFDVIKRYNSSDLYAMAVFQLSYYLTASRDKSNNG
jgi:membrane-bound lytic murein transglycosylase B